MVLSTSYARFVVDMGRSVATGYSLTRQALLVSPPLSALAHDVRQVHAPPPSVRPSRLGRLQSTFSLFFYDSLLQ